VFGEMRPERAEKARAAHAARLDADEQAMRAQRPALSVIHPGLRVPCIARRAFSFAGRKVERGERFDAAEGHWPTGRLRRFLQLGEVNRLGAWAEPQPENLADAEYACALNDSVEGHRPRPPSLVTLRVPTTRSRAAVKPTANVSGDIAPGSGSVRVANPDILFAKVLVSALPFLKSGR
jgi:hypothetical protein